MIMSSSSAAPTRTLPCTRSSTTVSPSRGRLEADGEGLAFLRRTRLAVAPEALVAGRALFRYRALAHGEEFLRCLEGAVGLALGEQLARHLGVACFARGLEDGRLVRGKAEPGQAVEDLLHRLLRGTRLVRVLDAQEVLPAVPPREQRVEQRRPRPADVEEAGGRGREAGADGHAPP
jgi:hypothetical protein